MIQLQTVLKIADNSGVKKVKCIKILGKSKKVKIGTVITVTVQKFKENFINKISNKMVLKAIVIRINKFCPQNNGIFFNLKSNSVIFLDNQKNPIGTRVIGFTPKKLKKKFNKLITISSHLV